MLPILNIIKSLNSNQLHDLHDLINQFAKSVKRLAEDVERREAERNTRESRKLSEHQKERLRKLQLQRSIMSRYQAGYSYSYIAEQLNFHPKTIARYVRKYQTDLTILEEIDRDILKRKAKIISSLVKDGMTKPQIVRALHVSAHLVTMVCHIEKLKLAA